MIIETEGAINNLALMSKRIADPLLTPGIALQTRAGSPRANGEILSR